MKGSGSRWNDLREINISSNTVKSSARRLTPTHSRRDTQHVTKFWREPSSVIDGSWGPQYNKAAGLASKEARTREVIESVKTKVASFAKNTNSNPCHESDDESLCASLEELSALVFGKSDPKCIIERKTACSSRGDSCASLSLLWEAADTTLGILKTLSPVKSCKLFKKSLTIAAASLQMINDSIQDCFDPSNHNRSFSRPRSMTDLRLCACASILLDILGCGNQDFRIEDDILLDSKSFLFSCLAKILAISKTIGSRDLSNSSRRSLLFPWGAERAVNLVARQSVLPFVKSIMSENNSMTKSSKIWYCTHAMESLLLLLKDHSGDSRSSNPHLSKHAAALLAPLVIDVKPDGQENQTPNPLRSSTLHAIVTFWNCSYQVIEEESQSALFYGSDIACECLTAALDSLNFLKRGKSFHSENEAPPPEIDVSSICAQIQNLLQNERLHLNRSKFLHLLVSLCRTYPGASVSQWHLFLEQPAPHIKPTRMARLPLLLSMVEKGTSAIDDRTLESKSMIILPDALHAVSVLLSSMPFSHWIAKDSNLRTRLNGDNFFPSRIRTSMLRVISCTFSLERSIRDIISDVASARIKACDAAQSIDHIIIHTAQLAGKLCTVLPYNGPNTMLLRPASKLVCCAGEIYILCTKAIEDTIARPTEPGCLEFYERARDNFSQVITGGADDDSTHSEPTVSPAQYWISDSSSFQFTELLLSRRSSSLGGKRMALLSRVAIICPWALTREPFNLAAFCELCTTQCKSQDNHDERVSGVELVKSFLIGRNKFSSEFASFDLSTVIVNTFCPILLLALNDPHPNVRGDAVASFGYMSVVDWMSLFHSSDNIESLNWQCLDAILRRCSTTHGENNSRVRSLACKAIGDISSCTLNRRMDGPLFTEQFVMLIAEKICCAIEDALKDECPSVRSMGLFAKGNIALALKERNLTETTLPLLPLLNTSFSSACECLNDKDEKVVTNAIRTLGHLSYFVYSSDFFLTRDPCESTKVNLYKNALVNLTSKVKRALDDAIDGTSAHLTWKQRNNAKKHAWGSCSTVGILLTFSNVLQYVGNDFIESVLLEQFRCVQFSKAIHDKIVAAAVHSLVTLPTSFWQMLPDNCDSIGRGLLSCFCYLCNVSKQTTPLSSYHGNIHTLATELLKCAKAKDFRHLFLRSDNTMFSVEYFYQWLVTNDVTAEVMEEIVFAVQEEEVQHCLDVSAVQMFVSRTVYRTKEQESPSKSLVGDGAQNDDGDEL